MLNLTKYAQNSHLINSSFFRLYFLKQYSTKKGYKSYAFAKKKSLLENCSENASAIVMDVNRKSIVGRLRNETNYVRSVPITYNFHGNFGDQVKISTNENSEEEGIRLDVVKRAKYTCGVIKIENNVAKLVHMNNHSHVLAYLPSVKNPSQFDANCLYSARISEFDVSRKVPLAKIDANLGLITCPLSQLQAHIMYCGLNEHVHYENCTTNKQVNNEQIEFWEPHITDLIDRRSFLDDCVITIDPETAADFDDALSLRHCDDGSFEIGVHIADVTHFVQPESENDIRAKKLCSSIYGKAKTFHMLPGILCKEQCSLKPGQLRLTCSVVLKYSPDGHFLDMWVGKGYIRSAARLTYEQADDILNSNSDNIIYNQSQNQQMWKVYGQEFQPSHVIKLAKNLHQISNEIWNRKMEVGRFSMSSQTLAFDIDPKTYKPTSMFLSKQLRSHQLVETMMCAANEAVASYLQQKLSKNGAFVRTHYVERTAATFDKLSKILNLPVTTCDRVRVSKGELSFSDFISKIHCPNMKLFAMNVIIQNTKKSVYIPTRKGSPMVLYYHGGLAAPLYTHFTSPIRRYADIVVHRQLADAFSGNVDYDVQQIKQLQQIADDINTNELQISTLEALDRKYYLNLYINEFGSFNAVGGKTDDEISQRVCKLFYPDIRCYLKTDLALGKPAVKFMGSVTSQVQSAPYPDWVVAKEIAQKL